MFDGLLKCPGCGGDYLHHGEVEVHGRPWEDGASYPWVVRGNQVELDDRRQSPSPRRDGVRIHFDCEGCEQLSALELWQHKGTTYVRWIRTGLKQDGLPEQLRLVI